MTSSDDRQDTPERPWETCNACNYDKHVCKGCGEPTTHAQGFVCPPCSSECKHEVMKASCADCNGMREETPDPYQGLLIQRFYSSARHTQQCAMSRRGLQDHDIEWGSAFALAVHDNDQGGSAHKRFGYVCDNCTNRIAPGA